MKRYTESKSLHQLVQRCKGEIGTSAWALASQYGWYPLPFGGVGGAAFWDFLNLQLGVSQPHVWID